MIPIALTPAVGNGIATVFTAASYVRNEEVVLNGLVQVPNVDYVASIVAGVTVITFTVAPVPTAVPTLFGNVLQAVGSGLANYETVATLVSDAAVELGLVAADIADPFVSTDATVIQLLRLLKSGGRDLAKHRDWQHLQKEYTFSTVNGVASYALPADYRKMVDDSEWNRSTQLPMIPVDGQTWQFLQAISSLGLIRVASRIWLGQMYLNPTPSSVQTLAYEYQSSSWIAPAGAGQPTLDAPAAATDLVCFAKTLVVARLKRDFRRNKKQDSAAEEEDYQIALSAAEHEDAQGKTIYLGGGRRVPHRIDRWNLPDHVG